MCVYLKLGNRKHETIRKMHVVVKVTMKDKGLAENMKKKHKQSYEEDKKQW